MNDDDINRVELRGRLTREPEMRTTTRGTSIASLGLATNRWGNAGDGERKQWVEYHNLIGWSGFAAQLGELRKGDLLHVRGRIQSRSWEGQDGQKRRTTEIVVDEIVPLVVSTTRRTPAALDEDVG